MLRWNYNLYSIIKKQKCLYIKVSKAINIFKHFDTMIIQLKMFR